MSESIRIEDEAERLVALQAIQTFRALRRAVKTAPHGKGLVTVEAVVRDKGLEQLQKMYEAAVREHPEAQKKGSAPGPAPAAETPASAGSRPSTC